MNLVNMVRGDFIFAQWHESGVDDFRKKESELISQGFEKINEDGDYLNMYATYSKDDKEVVLTMMCC